MKEIVYFHCFVKCWVLSVLHCTGNADSSDCLGIFLYWVLSVLYCTGRKLPTKLIVGNIL